MMERKFHMDQNDLQTEKELIWNFHQKLDGAQISEIGDIIAAHTDENYIWRGYHPFNEIRGSKEIANLFDIQYLSVLS